MNITKALTAAQEKYFMRSQIRDNNGELLVVYHGSKSKDFDEFQYSPDRQTGTDFGEAYYFTDDYEKAKAYTYDSGKDPRVVEWQQKKQELIDKYLETHDSKYIDARRELKVDGKNLTEILAAGDYDTGGSVISVYLDIRNPLVVDAQQRDYYKVYPEYFKQARENGHDGIVVKNVNDNPRGTPKPIDVYIAFYPNQIKSIDNLFPTHSRNFRDNSKEYMKENFSKMSPEDQFDMARVMRSQSPKRSQNAKEQEKRYANWKRNNDGLLF